MSSEFTHCTAIIVAGGKGTRMKSTIPKQFLSLAGKPVIYYSIAAFQQAIPDIHIVVVLPKDQIMSAQKDLETLLDLTNISFVNGGPTRFESVKNGLKATQAETQIIFVHDGARPLVSKALILRCYEGCKEYDSAIPTIPVSDSIRSINNDHSSTSVDRTFLRAIQTPQAFSHKLATAFDMHYQEKFTDEANVIEHAEYPVHLIEGDKKNIKITTPEDLIIAEAYMKTTSS